MVEKIPLFFKRFWIGSMVFKPLLVKGLILWSYKWTCDSMRWSQESPRLKKMFLTFVQALIYHHHRHHHLSFSNIFNITSTLFSSHVFCYIIMTFEQFSISFICMVCLKNHELCYMTMWFLYIWSIHVSCFMIGFIFFNECLVND